MLTYRTGAADFASVAARMADHLMEQTLPSGMADMAAYYLRGMQSGVEKEGPARGATTPEPRRDMLPEVARILGIDQNRPLDRPEVANLLNGRRADGLSIEGKQPHDSTDKKAAIGYIDLCFSADKSVSVAWAFARTEAERNIIMQAHRDAVDAIMRFIEQEIGWASKGRSARNGADRGHLSWIKFDHCTSRPTLAIRPDGKDGRTLTFAKDGEARTGKDELISLKAAGDPNLHTHCAVMNCVVTDTGRIGSIDLQRLNGRIHEFGALYHAFLATNLRRHGVDVVLDEETGAARITAIPKRVRDAFSKRTRDAHERAREHALAGGIDWDGMDEQARIKWLKGGAHGSRKSNADDLGDFAAWRAQAHDLGWTHGTVIRREAGVPLASRKKRMSRAFQASLPLLEKEFGRRSVLSAQEARIAAARGLIATGIEDAQEVGEVTKLMRRHGVRQDGRMTTLMLARGADYKGQEKYYITTGLHVDQERELIRLARSAARDKAVTLSPDEIAAAIRRLGLDFDNKHGRAQRDVMNRLGAGGRMAVMVGVAGSGKSTLLQPLVEAWRNRGHTVYGTALAWRQSDALGDAGIDCMDRAAFASFLHRAKTGKIRLDDKSVVVIDEVGLIGVRQALDLMRLQAKHGFRIIAIGDDKQCQSIEAGPVITLLRKALGKGAVPEIKSIVRQLNERDQDISLLFRAGKAEKALAMKRDDGTALVAPGGYRDAVERIADLWQERREANRSDAKFVITVSAPTNADARAISAAIRERRRQGGEVGADLAVIPATDQEGRASYDLPLAVGDRVRLFDRVNAGYVSGGSGILGNNGDILEVRGVDESGIVLRTRAGREGRVKWSSLRAKDSRRIRLTYGDAGTIDSQQGISSTEHINALPAGSRSVQGFKNYVAESRHRITSWLVTSEGAERQEIVDRRPLGDGRIVEEKDVWENMARNLSRQPEKMAATTFLRMAAEAVRGSARALQEAFHPAEQREAEGLEPTTLHDLFRLRQEAEMGMEIAEPETFLRERFDRHHEVEMGAGIAEPETFLHETFSRQREAEMASEVSAPATSLHETLRYRFDLEQLQHLAERIEEMTAAKEEFFRQIGTIVTDLPRDAAATLLEMRAAGELKHSEPPAWALKEARRIYEESRRGHDRADLPKDVQEELDRMREAHERGEEVRELNEWDEVDLGI